ncbi:MAG TPA: nucleotidyltransferase family protein, partial [Solirubrobacter sp.]
MSEALTPEFALLVEAARPTPRTAADRSAWARASYERAVEAAAWHRLEPMLAQHLAADEGVPADLQARLQERYFANAARNAFVAASLRDALAALTGAGVEAMLLKGAALTAAVYPDPAVREMLDVDVLVRSEQLDAANAALAALGYRSPPGSGEEQHSAGWMRANHHHDPALVADDGLLAIELHHHIAMKDERRHFDVGDLWERSRPHPAVAGHRLPAGEDLLLHVGFHFTRNRLGGSHDRSGSGGALSQLADLAWIVAREPLDWPRLAAHAHAYRLDARLFLALFAAHEVGFDIP